MWLELAERLLGVRKLRALGRAAAASGQPTIFHGLLKEGRRTLDITGSMAESLPSRGPVVVVANHAFGLWDPCAMCALVTEHRRDMRIMANIRLMEVDSLRPWLIGVDVMGGANARTTNMRSLLQAMHWLADGHVLCLFPAGEVSHRSRNCPVSVDPPWSANVGRLMMKHRAMVVPMWFEGENSPWFHRLGMVHPILRTAQIPREAVKQFGQPLRVSIGRPILPERMERLGDAQSVTDYLRVRCEMLGRDLRQRTVKAPVLGPQEPLIEHALHGPDALEEELRALPGTELYHSEGPYAIYCARASLIPRVLHEIGRLREVTFRAVGEGSGRAIDLDRYDGQYRHVFVWQRERREIVGAYRLGLARELMEQSGIKGLYLSNYFEFAPEILPRLEDALEMGRAWVRAEYQRKPLPLFLLWRGIALFIARHPRIGSLYGTVSVSDDFRLASKHVIVAFLHATRRADGLAELVKAKNPPKDFGAHHGDPDSWRQSLGQVAELEQLVKEIEEGRRTVPVLIRQYLKMEARVLAFNVDRDFGNVVDVLMWMDVPRIPERMLRVYMGQKEMGAYLAFQSAHRE
ncbi:MAG: lysophospholipid acyltransferase family protein [Planctomycetes bacterium]|nr:lysophospholipid acyltransferase family protein [Planctomycetota bacterium]